MGVVIKADIGALLDNFARKIMLFVTHELQPQINAK